MVKKVNMTFYKAPAYGIESILFLYFHRLLKLRTVGQEIKLECQKGVRLQIKLELRLDFRKLLL